MAAAGGPSVLKSCMDRGNGVSHSITMAMEDDDDGWDRLPAHLRPKILRRETSQILSYYHSADAGRSDSDYSCYPSPRVSQPFARGHRGTDIRHNRDTTESRSASPSSSYSYESVSDYGTPGAERMLGRWQGSTQRASNWDGDTSQNSTRGKEDGEGAGVECRTDVDVEVQCGIALGSPVGDESPFRVSTNNMTNTESGTEMARDANANGNTTTGVGTGYGSNPIILQFQPGHRRAVPPTQLNLPSAASRQSQSSKQKEEETQVRAQEQSGSTHNLHQVEQGLLLKVDSIPDLGRAPDEAPSRRRKVSSYGASDKRRVAVVQMDSGTEGEHEEEGDGEDGSGTLSDGFGRAEGEQAQARTTDHQQRAKFSVKPLPSSYSSNSSLSSHPPSAFASNPGSKVTSSLLARRGIVGTFAFVAPPDASPSAYTNLGYFTPPLSAPASARPTPPLLGRHESVESSTSANSNRTVSSGRRQQHQRSQSEAVLTGAHGSLNRTNPKADVDANLGEYSSKGEKRRPGHRLRKSSRDIGIVGTSTALSPTSGTMKTEVHLRHDETKARTATSTDRNSSSQAAPASPIFQTPSRSQTSLASSDGASVPSSSEPPAQARSASKSKRSSQQHITNTSGQGNSNRSSTTNSSTALRSQCDEIKAGVVVPDASYMWHASNVSTPSAFSSYYPSSAPSPSYSYYSMATTASSSSSIPSPPTVLTMPASGPSPYLYYQPGVHATAGPLPSPPRQIIPPKRDSPPPPRPPRLNTPSSGSSSLAKRKSDTSITSKHEHESASSPPEVTSPSMTPSTTSSTLVNPQSDDSVRSKGHTREGAFPIDSVIVTDPTHARPSVKQDQKEQSSLKRNNTMDELVRDVTAAIDGAASLSQKTSSTPGAVETTSPTKKDDPSPSPTRELNASKKNSGMNLRREESRSTFKGGELHSPSSPSSTYSDNDYDGAADITVRKPLPDPYAPSPQSTYQTESQESGIASKPQKMLDMALKRFSALPRPPSRLSASRASPRSSVSQDHSDTGHSAGHGSGLRYGQQRSAPPRTGVVFIAKIRSTCPEAMQFADVLAKRTPLERSLGYARKINELANHDPGLGDWVLTTKHNLTVPGKGSKRKSVSPGAVRSPSEHSFNMQPRQSSRGSIGSEMTFPKRVDAYVATDLIPHRSEDDALPRGPPPALPYPTLARNPPPNQQPSTRLAGSASTRSNASSLGSTKSGGGFFASIGRRASVKKDRPTMPGPHPNKLLSKRQQTTPTPAPRPVQISTTPSLPGGPRAPPGRTQRAQSVIAPKVTAIESETEPPRRISIKRSPSVAPPSVAQNRSNQVPESSPDIDTKINKLADLLPHADKKTLAGYLRRAGGMDMVAIGRYLDDEKNGVLIRG